MKMNTGKNYLKYVASLLLFGSNGLVASHIAMNSYEIVFFRTLIGSFFLLAVFFMTKGRFQAFRNKRHFVYLMISGAAMGASWMFLYEGYRQIGVSLATLAYYCGPVIVTALAPLIFAEKLMPAKIVGIIAALIGMVLINVSALRHSGFSWGLACGVMAAVMYAFMVVFNKKAVSITGLENSVWQLSASFVTVAVFTFIKQGAYIPIASGSIWPVLLLGVVNTGIGCYLYFSAIGHLQAQSVAVCGYLEPLSALAFSAVFLQEHLSPVQIIGAILILGGAASGEFFKRKRTHESNKAEKNTFTAN